MNLTIDTISDLVNIIETHPEWRRQLARALFPDGDPMQLLRELAETQRRLEETQRRMEAWLERLTTLCEQLDVRASRLEADVGELKADVGELKADMKDVKRTQGELKGRSYEQEYRGKADAIFGRYLRRGRNVTNDIADLLHDAENAGQITPQEFSQVICQD